MILLKVQISENLRLSDEMWRHKHGLQGFNFIRRFPYGWLSSDGKNKEVEMKKNDLTSGLEGSEPFRK